MNACVKCCGDVCCRDDECIGDQGLPLSEVLYNGPRFQIVKQTDTDGKILYWVNRPTAGLDLPFETLEEIRDSMGPYFPLARN